MAQNPLNPKAVSGTVTGSAATVYNIVDLIRAQLDPDAYGIAQEVQFQADLGNAASVFIGKNTPLGGDTSATNYGYALTPGGSRTYRSSYPGDESPVAVLQVFSTSSFTLHVETII